MPPSFDLLDRYAEERLAGRNADERFPRAAAHLRVCSPCLDDYKGPLAAVGA